MSEKKIVNLYELLPALYRLRDAERRYPLRALLEIIAGQVDLIKQNIDGLWDDFFIETCVDWVIPYIGDLVGNNPLHEVVQRRRADVAKTIYYRRRKGTLPMLEELARDVTGWGAHAVEFFQLLGWTQNLNHMRYQMTPNSERRDPNAVDRVGTVNLRNPDALDRLNGPFDMVSHTVDVRPISRTEGWYNMRKVGFFLWRLRNYPLTGITPRQADPPYEYGYHFSPLGNPAPLFNNPEREADEAGLAGEIHVPDPIRPIALHEDLERCRRHFIDGSNPSSDYYGEGLSLFIIKDNTPIRPEAIVCQNLKNWARPPTSVTYDEPDGTSIVVDVEAGIDPRLGRISFPPGREPQSSLVVAYNYGFSADIGGGPYDRQQTLVDPSLANWQTTVAKAEPTTTLQQALNDWAAQGKPNGIIEITDNGVYGGMVTIEPADDRWLVIQAKDGFRPTLRLVGNVRITGNHPNAALTLNGLLIEGGVDVQGSLGEFNIIHSTLVPGRTLTEDGDPAQPNGISVSAAAPNDRLRLDITSSIVGGLRLPAEMTALAVRDSIVDGLSNVALAGADDQLGPPTTLERTTLLGAVQVKELKLASEVIFTGPVMAQRRQAGCVRFSYVPEDSQTPRRYRCQPDLALEGVTESAEQARIRARLRPSFTSVHYGHPAYAQLSLTCAEEIRTGAEDGSEMGAFSQLKQPQRETNLPIRLEEYLPFGLEAGLIYVT